MDGSIENHDNHVYNWIYFQRDTVEFFIRAIDFYISLLGDEARELGDDPDLALLITDETRRELAFGRDKERAGRLRALLQENLERGGSPYDVDISLSHWTVRFIKSVSLLYLARLKVKRNMLASRPNVTATTLAALDREITSREEQFKSSGVFKNCSLIQLLAEGEVARVTTEAGQITPEPQLSSVERPRPVVVSSIQLLDHELRKRCLDLFDQFQESGQSDRNDTIVSEASRILENRLRKAVGPSVEGNAGQLAAAAFNAEKPILRVSAHRSEQVAALQLFTGTFGFIRNQVQHKLLEDIPADRVVQILGWIDYLLTVIAQAEVTPRPDAG